MRKPDTVFHLLPIASVTAFLKTQLTVLHIKFWLLVTSMAASAYYFAPLSGIL
jgi:hypothetical protein